MQALYWYGQLISEWMVLLLHFFRARMMSSVAKDLRILALTSQLALYQQQEKDKKIKKPRPTPAFRQLWVVLSCIYDSWDRIVVAVKPETVIQWRKTAFQSYWRKKSKKVGRPSLSPEIIALIRRLHVENPLLSTEKLHEKLIQLGIKNPPCANSIAKYLPSKRKPPTERQVQSWRTFLKNHMYNTWAMDFFTVPTLGFRLLYVLVIIHHGSREIVHYAITEHLTEFWLMQQIRNATPYGRLPKYLIHDNDPVFVSRDFQRLLDRIGIKSKRISKYSPWQNPYAERVIGTLRQELINHVIPVNEKHLNWLLKEYVEGYYNPHRTHQGIDGQTPIPSPQYPLTDVASTKLVVKPVLNGLYHTYKKVA